MFGHRRACGRQQDTLRGSDRAFAREIFRRTTHAKPPICHKIIKYVKHTAAVGGAPALDERVPRDCSALRCGRRQLHRAPQTCLTWHRRIQYLSCQSVRDVDAVSHRSRAATMQACVGCDDRLQQPDTGGTDTSAGLDVVCRSGVVNVVVSSFVSTDPVASIPAKVASRPSCDPWCGDPTRHP